MTTKQAFQGKVSDLRDRVKGRFNTVTDRDFETVGDNVDQLINLIEQKTGVTRVSIEEFINTVSAGGESVIRKATNAVREQASHASEAIGDGYGKVKTTVSDGYHLAENTVKQNPVRSIAIAFGAGLVAGAIFGYAMTRRSR